MVYPIFTLVFPTTLTADTHCLRCVIKNIRGSVPFWPLRIDEIALSQAFECFESCESIDLSAARALHRFTHRFLSLEFTLRQMITQSKLKIKLARKKG